ncbi:MAG: hypothetical protein ACE5K8_02360 [Candidatus Zixiibacteriota bacterium]
MLDMRNVSKKIWLGWKKVALKIARFQSTLLLTLFYFLILVPLGLVFRLFGWDPLESRRSCLSKTSNWKPVTCGEPSLVDMHRQS